MRYLPSLAFALVLAALCVFMYYAGANAACDSFHPGSKYNGAHCQK